jgi:Fe-S oxidoreductase
MNPPFHLAKEQELHEIGFEPIPQKDRKNKLLSALSELRTSMRSLSVMLETCTKCGNCRDQCHSYLGTRDHNNFPAARAELVRRVYKRHFTLAGRLLGSFVGADDFDDETIERWLTYFYQCNECRRCAVFCPFGIDTAEITIAARHVLSQAGLIPRFMQGVAANMQKTGNNMGIPKPALLDSAEFLEDEIKEETGVDVKIPIDKPDSDILYIPSSADFFTNVDTLMGAAKVFHTLDVNWTIPSSVLEAANFGLLFNQSVMREHNQRLEQAASSLGAKLVLQGECGHGWRAAKFCTEEISGPVSFELRHVLEFVDEHLSELPLRKMPVRVSLHDPCNYSRAGDLIDQPRRIIQACVEEFVEMTPNREKNFCCGGGSGILMDEMMDIRMKLGKKKAEQVKALGHLDFLASPCSICKAQLPHVMKHNDMDDLVMGGVLDLVGMAIQMGSPDEGGDEL